VLELERRINILSRALHLILFEEVETLPEKEIDELKERLNAYLQGRREEFASLNELLKDVQGNNTQKGIKRD